MSATDRAGQPPVNTIGGASGVVLPVICGCVLHLHAREIGMITDDSHFGKVQDSFARAKFGVVHSLQRHSFPTGSRL
jgi:hypothetical protein